jgi:hypothetical protein
MSRTKSGTFVAGFGLLFLLLTGCSPTEVACTEIGAAAARLVSVSQGYGTCAVYVVVGHGCLRSCGTQVRPRGGVVVGFGGDVLAFL